jgi:hypothetical protein
MVRTRRTAMISVVSMVLLLSAALGAGLGKIPQREWDLFLARLRSDRIVSVAPKSHTRATLYVFDEDRPLAQEVRLDLRVSGNDVRDSWASVPVLLAADRGPIEMTLDDGLTLRMELVGDPSSTDERPVPAPLLPPIETARR